MNSHYELIDLLKKGHSVLRKESIEALLPKPFSLQFSSHDTGCQACLYMTGEGLQTMYVWEGSVWYSKSYEFNDRDKVLGIKPGMEFALPFVEKFFADLETAVERHESAKRAAEEELIAAAEEKTQFSIKSYKKMLGVTEAA